MKFEKVKHAIANWNNFKATGAPLMDYWNEKDGIPSNVKLSNGIPNNGFSSVIGNNYSPAPMMNEAFRPSAISNGSFYSNEQMYYPGKANNGNIGYFGNNLPPYSTFK
jgi:hypothetical protein